VKRLARLFRRLSRRLLCKLGRHEADFHKLYATGEKWTTFIFACQHCNHVGDSYAARADSPVSIARNK
jgi:hypothetical protein